MAEEKDTIILDFQINTGEAVSELEKTKKAILDLKDQQKALNKESEDYVKDSIRLEQELKKQTQSYSTLTKAVQTNNNSINALTQRNKELREERNNVDLSTAEGIKRLKEINIQLDRNNDIIKRNVSDLEKQKINIGNYASALGGLGKNAAASIPGISGLSSGIGGIGAGITGLSGPLAAITIGIQVFSAAIKKSQPVLDFFEDWFTKISAGVEAFINNISLVGDIIGDVFTGDFASAAANTQLLATAIGDAADESQRLLELTRELEDAEMLFRVETAAAANQMKAYVVASKNKSLSIEESNALLQKASDLENDLTKKAVELAQQKADIEEGNLVLSQKVRLQEENLLRKAGQSQKDYIQELIKSGIFDPAELTPLIEAYERVEQEASNGFAFQEKIANQQEALRQKEAADIEKRQALREKEQAIVQKQIDLEIQLDIKREENALKEFERVQKELMLFDARQAAQQKYIDSILDGFEIQAEVADELDEETLKAIDSGRKRVNTETQKGKAIAEVTKLEQDAAAVLKENTIAGKATSATLATANTFLGATEALKQPSSLPSPFDTIAKIANVAAIIASGLSAVKNITAAAGGGDFVTRGPQLLLVGDNPGGRERVTVEPLSGRGRTVMGGNMIKLAGGGVVETQSQTASARANFAFANTNQSPVSSISITELREFNDKIQFKENLVTA